MSCAASTQLGIYCFTQCGVEYDGHCFFIRQIKDSWSLMAAINAIMATVALF